VLKGQGRGEKRKGEDGRGTRKGCIMPVGGWTPLPRNALLGDFRLADHLGYIPQVKISGAITVHILL